MSIDVKKIISHLAFVEYSFIAIFTTAQLKTSSMGKHDLDLVDDVKLKGKKRLEIFKFL